MNINEFVGQKIREKREEQGHSITWMAKKLRIHVNTLTNYENGYTTMSYQTYLKICNVLKVGITELLPSTWKELGKGL